MKKRSHPQAETRRRWRRALRAYYAVSACFDAHYLNGCGPDGYPNAEAARARLRGARRPLRGKSNTFRQACDRVSKVTGIPPGLVAESCRFFREDWDGDGDLATGAWLFGCEASGATLRAMASMMSRGYVWNEAADSWRFALPATE